MEIRTWKEHSAKLNEVHEGIVFTQAGLAKLDTERGFAMWHDMTLEVGARRGTVYLVGNGASASMASHFAADLAKNARLHTQVFSDLSLITAISNDIGYDQVFAEPLRRRGVAGDMLVAISSSGKSPNILAAAEVAEQLKMTLVTLTAMGADNPLRRLGQLNLYAPALTYGLAESAHAAALHWWMDLVQLGRAPVGEA